MQPRRTERHRRLLVRLVTSAAAGVFVLSATPPASAHTDLVSSDPKEGVSLQAAPASISLVFNEEMDPRLGAASLSIDDRLVGPLTLEAGPTTTSVVALFDDQDLPATVGVTSSWVVSYRVTSPDGHPVSGAVSFAVAASAAEPAQPAVPPATVPPSTATPDVASDSHAGEGPRRRSDESTGLWPLAAPIAAGLLLLLLVSVLAVTRLVKLPTREPAPDPTDGPAPDDAPTSPSTTTGLLDEPSP